MAKPRSAIDLAPIESRKSAFVLAAAVALFSCGPIATGTTVVADFGDIASGAINGKGGGAGWLNNWSGSAGGTVVANNLTSSLYNLPQSGAAQHFRNVNATGLRQNYRTPAILSGTIWFSFLAMAEATGDRAGLSLNAPTATPFNDPGTAYAYLEGDTLRFQLGPGTAGSLASAAPVGSTALIVGRIDLNAGAGGADPVSLWLNPNLAANSDISTFTPFYSNASIDWLSAITVVGAVAARADTAATGGGNLDNIRFSDGGGNASQAYADVTGVPEPGTAALLAVALLTMSGRRRWSR